MPDTRGGTLTSSRHWDRVWSDRPERQSALVQHWEGILRRHLPAGPSIHVLEIGCVPGQNLVWFAKQMGYRVSGVDYSESMDDAVELLRREGVCAVGMDKQDVFDLDGGDGYDTVCSFGVVEHFIDPGPIIRQHFRLTRRGGYVVIGVPNYRYLRFHLKWHFAPEFAKHHNFRIMDRRRLRRHIERAGGRVIRCDYDVTYEFWPPRGERARLKRVTAALIGTASRQVGKFLQRIGCADLPNPLFSPHIIAIATKV